MLPAVVWRYGDQAGPVVVWKYEDQAGPVVVWRYGDLETAIVSVLSCQGLMEGGRKRGGEVGGLAFPSVGGGPGGWGLERLLTAEPVGWEGGEEDEGIQRLGVELP